MPYGDNFGDTLPCGVKDQDVRVSATSRGRVTCCSKWPLARSRNGGGDSVGLGFQASCEGVAQLRFQRLNTTYKTW